MAQKNDIFKQELKKKGYFNFSGLYGFCFGWLEDEGFKIAEKKYEEKVSGGGKEINIEWEAKKKITDYIQFVIGLKWKALGLKDAEVEREGKKESTNKGDIKLEFKATFVSDYEDMWEKKPLWKLLRGVYDKYVIQTTLDEYEGKLIGTAVKFVKETKTFLELEV